jgi:hypothetical protein
VSKVLELLRQGRRDEVWQMCCGFLDLSLEQFMNIQKRLLLEQIELLKNCELGRKVMHGAMPETIDEFREQVPITTYADYYPNLTEKREEGLPAKTARWVQTSGKSGEYSAKWVPWSQDFCKEFESVSSAAFLLAFCKGKGDMSQVRDHMKVLFTLGPPHSGTGAIAAVAKEAIGFDFLPSDVSEDITFQERIRQGFAEALYQGIDVFGGFGTNEYRSPIISSESPSTLAKRIDKEQASSPTYDAKRYLECQRNCRRRHGCRNFQGQGQGAMGEISSRGIRRD